MRITNTRKGSAHMKGWMSMFEVTATGRHLSTGGEKRSRATRVRIRQSKAKAKLFKVGSQSKSCTKTISGTSGYSCPQVLTKHTWYMRGLPHARCNDKFTVSQSGDKLTVKRVDAGGRNCHGWGMKLQFKCTKATAAS
jgi:hypothetical protein